MEPGASSAAEDVALALADGDVRGDLRVPAGAADREVLALDHLAPGGCA